MSLKSCGVAVALLCSFGLSQADDWPAFRGPSGNGISAEKAAPIEWSATKNVKWKAALPRKGNGSPIVSNGRVFVTCVEDEEAVGKKRSLYCFDRKDGKKLWVKTVEYAKADEKGNEDTTHGTNPHCNSTPAADGKVVVAWHSSAGLHAYDFEGKELWKRDLGEFRHIWGSGTSPIIHDGKVILNSGPGKKVFMGAFNLADGKTIWEMEEPSKGDDPSYNEDKKYKGSWSTPIVVKVGGQEQILCAMPTRVVAYAPADGKILWWCEGIRAGPGDRTYAGDLTYSSLVVAGDICVVVGGFGGAGFGVRLGGTGNVTATHQVWRNAKNPQSIGSGVVVGDHIYMPFEGPITCLDPKTGKTVWKERGSYWGSAVSVGGRIYLTDQKGATVVFKPNPERLELIGKNELGDEGSNSTPAVSDGQIFIRTFKNLYCIGE
jgi:outer membrane protein assembly factor BamB